MAFRKNAKTFPGEILISFEGVSYWLTGQKIRKMLVYKRTAKPFWGGYYYTMDYTNAGQGSKIYRECGKNPVVFMEFYSK